MKQVTTNENGTTVTTIKGKDSKPTLEEAQLMVGGWIEIVTIKTDKIVPKGTQLVLNEEGHLRGMSINELATAIYHSTCIPGTTHTIVGNVVVLMEGAQLT